MKLSSNYSDLGLKKVYGRNSFSKKVKRRILTSLLFFFAFCGKRVVGRGPMESAKKGKAQ